MCGISSFSLPCGHLSFQEQINSKLTQGLMKEVQRLRNGHLAASTHPKNEYGRNFPWGIPWILEDVFAKWPCLGIMLVLNVFLYWINNLGKGQWGQEIP